MTPGSNPAIGTLRPAATATCHDFVGKYLAKARNGFLHSIAFTTGSYANPLQIRPMNREVTERQCRSRRGEITEAIEWGTARDDPRGGVPDVERSAGARPKIHDGIIEGDRLSCIRCHTYGGHMVR